MLYANSANGLIGYGKNDNANRFNTNGVHCCIVYVFKVADLAAPRLLLLSSHSDQISKRTPV
ncbi:hypothetical protein EZS27_024524 [termite gut metagenome]|uniref:Uncharacterized protein n=1 Tax=termite gut metagenome TaxID=433724 RepID=A0A5J4QYH4_9ZZZZ